MSSKEILTEGNKLLSKNWLTSEKELIQRLLDNIISYKSLIPKTTKKDITELLILSNHIKEEYDELKKLVQEKHPDDEKEIEQIEKMSLDNFLEKV
jgi:hypothetical protein